MVKFAHGLKTFEILLQDRFVTSNNKHLLTMTKFCYNVKKWRVIHNDIMIFHNQLQPTTQNPHPYTKMWEKVKLQHKYCKVLFALLERTLTNDLIKGKICMNPSKDHPFDEFNEVFEKWIQGIWTKTHIWGLCAQSHNIGWILYQNSITLRTLWTIVQGVSIFEQQVREDLCCVLNYEFTKQGPRCMFSHRLEKCTFNHFQSDCFYL